MKVIFSLNEEAYDFDKKILIEESNYKSSFCIIKEFISRGDSVYTIIPSDIRCNSPFNVSANHYLHNLDGFKYIGCLPISGDLFFVRSLSEDNLEYAHYFMEHLFDIENQVGLMINSALSTSYENKINQKKLNLPFIPDFRINNKKDLEILLKEEKRIIAKPFVGAMGLGVKYLDSPSSLEKISEESLANYCFEKYIPEQIEKRFIFLDREIVIRRGMKKVGRPGEESIGYRWLLNEDTSEKEKIVRSAMDQTGMFYGCVDFRGDYVLEINGSGTGAGALDDQKKPIYDLTSKIVDKAKSLAKK